MPRPGVAVQDGEIRHHLRAQGVEVDVAGHLQQVRLRFHQDRFVPILKQVSVALVPVIERDDVPGEQPAHGGGQGLAARAHQ